MAKIHKIVVLVLATSSHALSQGLTIPSSDAGIADSISNALPAPYTADELATPPAGEILKLRLRAIGLCKTALQAALTSVPVADQSNFNYRIAQTAAQKLELISTGRRQEDLFNLIDEIVALNEAVKIEESPSFVRAAADALDTIKSSILEEMKAYIVRLNAAVPADKLVQFVNAFTKGEIVQTGDWEEQDIPVSSTDIMILDASAVVTQLKSQPWKYADRFLERATSTEAFTQYTTSGDGLEALKSKYAANQATIVAKWNELTDWVAQERIANP